MYYPKQIKLCYNEHVMIMNRESKLNYYTYTLNMTILNILAIILFMLVGGLVIFIERHDTYTVTLPITILFILMFGWLLIHELLHGIAFFIFKEVKKENITFGMFLEKGVFYCMCKQNIGKKVILTSLLFLLYYFGTGNPSPNNYEL